MTIRQFLGRALYNLLGKHMPLSDSHRSFGIGISASDTPMRPRASTLPAPSSERMTCGTAHG